MSPDLSACLDVSGRSSCCSTYLFELNPAELDLVEVNLAEVNLAEVNLAEDNLAEDNLAESFNPIPPGLFEGGAAPGGGGGGGGKCPRP